MSQGNIISPNFNPKPQDRMQDHVWVLFVLADISKYFEERNLPEAAAVLEEAIFGVEAEILGSPSGSVIQAGADLCMKEPINPTEVEPHVSNAAATRSRAGVQLPQMGSDR